MQYIQYGPMWYLDRPPLLLQLHYYYYSFNQPTFLLLIQLRRLLHRSLKEITGA